MFNLPQGFRKPVLPFCRAPGFNCFTNIFLGLGTIEILLFWKLQLRTLYSITSSVLQKEPHRCCRTSLIVSTWNAAVNDGTAVWDRSHTNLLPDLLVDYNVY
jgi:hypothetical protein